MFLCSNGTPICLWLSDLCRSIFISMGFRVYPEIKCYNVHRHHSFRLPSLQDLLICSLVVQSDARGRCDSMFWWKHLCNWNTYTVPAAFVLMWVWSSSLSFAIPKSEILAFKSWSSSILLALISRCTTLIADSSCRYARPLAIPRQILYLVGQSSLSLYCSTGPSINSP